MAKKAPAKVNGNVNKSQAIREALEKDPNIPPKQLSADLIAQGINATPQYVSMIKTNTKSKAKKVRRATAAASRQPDKESAVVASELVETKKLVDRVGGVEKAELLLGTLKKLL